MAKKRSITAEDILSAREIVRKFGFVEIKHINRDEQIDLVRTRYRDIRGVPIENLPSGQLYSIAERLYYKSHRILSRINRGENLEGTTLS